jgi:hypothetical protein
VAGVYYGVYYTYLHMLPLRAFLFQRQVP